MSTVAIQPSLLRWARERAGLGMATLEAKFPRYPSWEAGEAAPTLKQLETLAHKTMTPLGYFFLPEPPEERLPLPDFRTVRDQGVYQRPSPNLLETIQMMQRRQDWLRENLIELGHEALAFVGAAKLSDNPERVAHDIRRQIGIGDSWANDHSTWTDALRDLRHRIEAAGVVVTINGVVGNNTHRALDPEEFRGFVLSDPVAPLIFVNGADAKSAQMFTLAHELAHLWIGSDGVFNLLELQPSNDEVEQFCNRVAAEFLIPSAELARIWPQSAGAERRFNNIAARFKVSPIVAARRALDLGLINKSEFFSFYNDYKNEERRRSAKKSSGGDFYATQEVRVGRRFGEAVTRAAREGRILFTDAYQLTGLYGQTFDRFAKGVGVSLK
jgi:Zn-dependent peptidase ImmA (M78 family)/transcriptional regulator with XRE-family HTH domain